MRRRHRWGLLGPRYLVAHTQVRVRFQEVDSLRVVWHGHYLSYCEEGRQNPGKSARVGGRLLHGALRVVVVVVYS